MSLDIIVPSKKFKHESEQSSSQSGMKDNDDDEWQDSQQNSEHSSSSDGDNEEAKKNGYQLDNISFKVDDIESLQDAEIDNKLLENHFINPSKGEVMKRQLLQRYAMNYGYFLIPKRDLFSRKFQHFFKQKIHHHKCLMSYQLQLTQLNLKIKMLQKNMEVHDIYKQTKVKDLQLE